MDDKTKELIRVGREFMKGEQRGYTIVSDQMKKLPQPPLFKAPKEGGKSISLPKDFEALDFQGNLFELLQARKSRRLYTEKPISMVTLSFLLWSMFGVKGRRGKSYATLRTAPSGGARHGFECYFDALHVEGLEPGIYHYLPETHSIEWIGTQTEEERIQSVEGQKWATLGAVLFYISAIPYRNEWRYSTFSHKIALVDLGHVGENLYLAAETLGLGTCGIGAVSLSTNKVLGLDGDDEFLVYAQPVGWPNTEEKNEEAMFYSFVEEEGL